ncbi:MAG TPA: hypothetical protein VNH18_21830 [Bryobacteraceae bacterium]|nr:hypothetical protein [Bryobacteraceae bacterium]
MRITPFLAGTLMLSANAFAVDTQLLNMVMPEAQIMAGVNVTTAKISPFGQYVLNQFRSDDKGLQDLISQTGFDPRQDVTEILAATTGNPGMAGGLVLARGNFNADKIAATATAKGGSAVVSQYAGATLITVDGKETKSVAFVGNSIAVIGDTASVKAALDRAGNVNSISPALATRVQALSTTLDAWTVSLASIGSLLPSELGGKNGAMAQPLQVVKNIESSSGGVKFGANVEVSGQAVANTAENARALADIVRMVAGLVTMGGGQDPKMAGVAQLVQTLKVSTDGNAVNLSASVPEAQLEALLHPAVVKTN